MYAPEFLPLSKTVAYRTQLAENEAIRIGESLSDRAIDIEDAGLNARAENMAHVWVEVREAFPEGTRLKIQLIESYTANLTHTDVLGETGELTEHDLTVGERPLLIAFNQTKWRYIGLRFVSMGENRGGRISSVLTVEKPAPREYLADLQSSRLSMAAPLPPREPMRIG